MHRRNQHLAQKRAGSPHAHRAAPATAQYLHVRRGVVDFRAHRGSDSCTAGRASTLPEAASSRCIPTEPPPESAGPHVFVAGSRSSALSSRTLLVPAAAAPCPTTATWPNEDSGRCRESPPSSTHLLPGHLSWKGSVLPIAAPVLPSDHDCHWRQRCGVAGSERHSSELTAAHVLVTGS